MKRVLALGAALLVTAAPALAIPRPGERAPALSLPDMTGRTLTLATLRGTGVYLNFFASWCGPCRVETPSIVALSKKYGRRVRIIGVDVGEGTGKADGFAHDFAIPYTLVVDTETVSRATYGGGLYFPLHVFIDRNGVVQAYHPGEMSAADIETALRTISR